MNIFILIILGLTAVSIYFYIRSYKKLIKYLESKWGESTSQEYNYNNFENIGAYWKFKSITENNKTVTGYIDELTWNDLDMNEVFLRINNTESIIGESYLYDRLHRLSFDEEELGEFEKLVGYIDKNESTRLRIQVVLRKFGKRMCNEIPSYLFKIEEKKSYYRPIYRIIGIVPVIGLVGMVINFQMGITLLCMSILLNAYIYYRHHNKIAYEMDALTSIYLLLKTAKKISKIDNNEELMPICKILRENCSKLKGIMGFEAMLFLSTNTDLGILQEYVGIITLSNFRIHDKFLKLLKQDIGTLQSVYSTLGMLETSIAVASYRRSVQYWSRPKYVQDKKMEVKGVYHPLIEEPVCNDVKLIRNSIITGSNASGKSTFVKSLAINGILGQSINTVLAMEFISPLSYYMTSMAISDNIITSESYYIAEIRSLKRILDAISRYPFSICFIDEILKGTNTIERIAASSAILKYLNQLECLCVTASHDIEITQMLEDKYDNYHFRETIDKSQIKFDYKIRRGPSTTRNAIKLLEFMDYDKAIIDDANKLASYFSSNQTWLKP